MTLTLGHLNVRIEELWIGKRIEMFVWREVFVVFFLLCEAGVRLCSMSLAISNN